jgi:hypothetical protein
MSRTWPLELQHLGGISLLANRAAEAQCKGRPGEFFQAVTRKGALVKVRFSRAGYDIAMTMETRGGSLLYVTRVEMIRRRGRPVHISFGKKGEIEVKFDKGTSAA